MASQDASITEGDARLVHPRASETSSSEALFEVEAPHRESSVTPTVQPNVPEPAVPGTPKRQIIQGDARHIPQLEDNSVDLVVTSPPYWQKRDYKVTGQIGQEAKPAEYVQAIMDCLTEWQRV